MNVRFTTWLSEREREALHDRAVAERTSANAIARTAIREYLGFDPPSGRLLHVTSDTSNTKVRDA
jgi:hypothetical protein